MWVLHFGSWPLAIPQTLWLMIPPRRGSVRNGFRRLGWYRTLRYVGRGGRGRCGPLHQHRVHPASSQGTSTVTRSGRGQHAGTPREPAPSGRCCAACSANILGILGSRTVVAKCTHPAVLTAGPREAQKCSRSEVKQCRAPSVLGWGIAWEDLRVLSAFPDVCHADSDMGPIHRVAKLSLARCC